MHQAFREAFVMKQAALSRWLKAITIIIGLMGLAFYAGVFPAIVNDFGMVFPEFKRLVLPSLIGIWASGVPCYVSLALFWGICTRIGRDRSFCAENARGLQWIGKLAIFDAVLCLAVTVLLVANGAINPGIYIIAFTIMFAGAAVALAALALSHLVLKAAQLKDENDLTI
jgi:hypothetical protein